MNDNSANVLGLLETHVAPGLSGVLGLVDSVAPRRAALIVVLSRSHPQDVGTARRHCDVTDRRRALMIEDRLPRRTTIRRLPDATRGRRDIEQFAEPLPDLRFRSLGNGEVDDTTARHRRPNRSPRQLGESRRVGVEGDRRGLGHRCRLTNESR